VPTALQGRSNLALVARASASPSAGFNLHVSRQIFLHQLDIFVVNIINAFITKIASFLNCE